VLVESVGVSPEVEKVRSEAHRRFAGMMFEMVQGLLPKTVLEQEIRIVSQAMVGAINEVVIQNYNDEGNGIVHFDELARLLNRMVIAAFVNLAN